ncbi:MAG: hypothetical protein RLY16_1562 [Bacteroidota bacterium]
MKKSLRIAISLFSLGFQLKLLFGFFIHKLRFTPRFLFAPHFLLCNKYVALIEAGVELEKYQTGIVLAKWTVNGRQLSFLLRQFSSDIQVFETVILEGEYEVAAQHLQNNLNAPQFIIDAGANVGFTTLYLHAYFPNTQFALVEPDQHNFSVLKKNLSINKISKAALFQGALWTKHEQLSLTNDFRDGKDWSLSVKPVESAATDEWLVDGFTLQDIIDKLGANQIDLLKMDIEGAERFLYNNEQFLQSLNQKVHACVLEIHDEFNIRPLINQEMDKGGYQLFKSPKVDLFARTSKAS